MNSTSAQDVSIQPLCPAKAASDAAVSTAVTRSSRLGGAGGAGSWPASGETNAKHAASAQEQTTPAKEGKRIALDPCDNRHASYGGHVASWPNDQARPPRTHQPASQR